MAEKVKKRRSKWLYIGLGSVIVALIAASVLKGKSGGAGEKIYAEKVEKRTIIEKVSASGRIFPEKEIKISSDASGEIVELLVREGDSVKAGQLLCRVNPEIYKDQVARGEASVGAARAQYTQSQSQIEATRSRRTQLEAQREQLQAQLEQVRSSFRRNEQLLKDGVISTADFENSQSQLKSQEASIKQVEANLAGGLVDVRVSEDASQAAQFQVKSNEASLNELKKTLNKTSIYAPASGVVSKLNVEKGERVLGTVQNMGTEIMRIANLSAMEVQVNIPENDIVKLRVGNAVDIDIDAYRGRKFKGTVTEIASTASNATTATGQANLTTDQVTNFVVKIRVEAASYADLAMGGRSPFRPGMSASVDILTQTVADVVSVPIGAVTMREDETLKQKMSLQTDKKQENQAEKTAVLVNEKEVIFVVSGDTARMVEVKTGIQDDRFIQIVSGLKGDEEIIAAPYSFISRKLKSGSKIKKVSEKELYEAKK
ncbi:MAG: hypothetical protein RL757_2931 [Bacteroidota bacterium]|jgi:HlyD family secretion protein